MLPEKTIQSTTFKLGAKNLRVATLILILSVLKPLGSSISRVNSMLPSVVLKSLFISIKKVWLPPNLSTLDKFCDFKKEMPSVLPVALTKALMFKASPLPVLINLNSILQFSLALMALFPSSSINLNPSIAKIGGSIFFRMSKE